MLATKPSSSRPMQLQLLLPLLLLAGAANSLVQQFDFNVNEDDSSPTRRLIGSVQLQQLQHLVYEFEPTVPARLSAYFTLDASDGQLRTSNLTLDRDTMCVRAGVCCQQLPVCSIELQVKAQDRRERGKKHRIRVLLKLLDLNDNSPTFVPDSIERTISESASIDHSETLPVAEDPDVGVNAVDSYELFDSSDHFALVQHSSDGSRLEPKLKLKKKLDREVTKEVTLIVVARDSGSPKRSGSLTVTVRVADSNDNAPDFGFVADTLVLREDTPLNHLVGRFNASDADEGLNAKLVYSLHKRSGKSAADGGGGGELFRIDRFSGDVYLNRKLDFETEESHVLVITAVDRNGQGHRDGLSSRSSSVTVTVSVANVNDEPPVIKFSAAGVNSNFTIEENGEPNSAIAWAAVSDNDKGAGHSAVTCVLLDRTGEFSITPAFRNEYKILSLQPLDRERTPKVHLRLNCSDSGEPPLHTVGAVSFTVLNVNDNKPQFHRSRQRLQVKENQAAGQFVYRFNASDGDGDSVTYRMDQVSDSFRLDPGTGRLFTTESFDREVTSQYRLTVVATDSGQPPLSSDPLEVVVDVLDVNDNSPRFQQNLYQFNVDEEQEGSVAAGFVEAKDDDSGENGQVVYSISEYAAKLQFKVGQSDGKLTVKGKLDREQKSRLTFAVVATDRGSPRRSASAQVTVVVEDKNDNSPRFIFPGMRNTTVDTSCYNPEHSTVAEVQARDDDAGANAEILYFIRSGNSKGLFAIDAHTGRLLLARGLSRSDCGSYSLSLEAKDNGSPSKSAQATLIVRVRDIPADPAPAGNSRHVPRLGGGGGFGRGRGGTVANPRNLILVICLVAIASVLAAVFLAIIVCLRRRPPLTGADEAEIAAYRSGVKRKADIRLLHGIERPPMQHSASGATLLRAREGNEFKTQYPTLGLPQSHQASLARDQAKMQTLRLVGGGDGNMYYRIPASDDSYERNSATAAAAAAAASAPNMQQQQQQQQQQHQGYQVLQPNFIATAAERQWQRPETLQVDKATPKEARRANQSKSFSLVSSSFV